MDPITQQRLAYILGCVSEEAARSRLSGFQPIIRPDINIDLAEIAQSRAQAEQIVACVYPNPLPPPRELPSFHYPNPETVERCFRQVLQSNALPNISQLLPHTDQGRLSCGNFAPVADDSYAFLDTQSSLRNTYDHAVPSRRLQDLDSYDQGILQGVFNFYYGLLSPLEREELLLNNLRNVPEDLVDRRAAYHLPSEESPQVLHSPLGQGARLFRTEYLVVPHFRYQIPVVFPISQERHWPTFQRNLRFIFELFKLFITPQNLERILRPGNGSPDFAILLGPRAPVSPEFIADLHIEDEVGFLNDSDIAGYATSSRNYIMFRQNEIGGSLIYVRAGQAVLEEKLSNIFFHEFAHHIDYSSFTLHEHENLSILLSYCRAISQVNPGNTFCSPRLYSLRSIRELFADFAMEWMVYQTERFLGIPHPVLNPLAARHREARLDLMGQFFSQDGMRRQVFESENIEATYRRHGIEVNLDEVAASMLSVEARVAVQQDPRGQIGGEVSVAVRTNSRRQANVSFGASAGLFSPGGNLYVLGEVGVRSPLARFQIESSVVNGVDLSNGNVLLGAGARFFYFPFDPGFGLNFSAAARVLADTHEGELRGVFQLGVGYVPRWSF